MPSVVIELRDEDDFYDNDVARADWEDYERELRCEQEYYGLCWPYACKACGGWGVKRWVERHDEGPGEHMAEDCSACLGQGDHYSLAICPRCAWALYSHPKPALPCHACSWNYDEGIASLY